MKHLCCCWLIARRYSIVKTDFVRISLVFFISFSSLPFFSFHYFSFFIIFLSDLFIPLKSCEKGFISANFNPFALFSLDTQSLKAISIHTDICKQDKISADSLIQLMIIVNFVMSWWCRLDDLHLHNLTSQTIINYATICYLPTLVYMHYVV